MSLRQEIFYVAKYEKGFRGELVKEYELKEIKLPFLQKIFDIDPNDPDPINRDMVDCYNVGEKEAKQFYKHVSFKFDLERFDYQTGLRRDVNENQYYVICEFEKSIPWKFIEECKLNVSLDFLRLLFKDEKYDYDPTNPEFSPKINSKQYTSKLEPFINFKFELDNYDYWIEKRCKGEPRNPDMNVFF